MCRAGQEHDWKSCKSLTRLLGFESHLPPKIKSRFAAYLCCKNRIQAGQSRDETVRWTVSSARRRAESFSAMGEIHICAKIKRPLLRLFILFVNGIRTGNPNRNSPVDCFGACGRAEESISFQWANHICAIVVTDFISFVTTFPYVNKKRCICNSRLGLATKVVAETNISIYYSIKLQNAP